MNQPPQDRAPEDTAGPEDALMAAYLDDRLDETERAAFEQRFTEEPAVARRLAEHLLLEADLRERAVSAAPLGRDTTRLVASATRRRMPRPRRLRWSPALVGVAAAALVALMVPVIWMIERSQSDGQAVTVELVHPEGRAGRVQVDGVSRALPTTWRLGQTLTTSMPITCRWRDHTTVAVSAGDEEARLRLLADGLALERGVIVAEVVPRGPAQVFRIEAGDAVATVLGTRFRLERQGSRTLLAVASGRVELRQGTAALVVAAGGTAIADATGVVATPSPSAISMPAAAGVDLARGLLARWSGESLDGNRLRDLSPAGHHGEATGVQAVAAPHGQALRFAGERSSATIPHLPALDVGEPQQPFALALWVRLPAGSRQQQTLIAKGRSQAQPGPTLAICLDVSPERSVSVYRWHDGPAVGASSMEASTWASARLVDDTWHHLAVVCEHATLRHCYLDGRLVGSDRTWWRNDTRNRSRWSLGRVENMGFTDESPFTGDLADVRLYGRVLSAAEVAALAQGGR